MSPVPAALPIRILLLCCLIASPALAAPDRITSPVDSTRRATLRQNRAHPAAITAADQGPLDPATRIGYATLHLRPGPGLDIFLADQQDPASPNFHRWLTPEQFGDRFGASPADLAQLRLWLESEGLRVNDTARGRLWITFSGTAAQIQRAFRTELHRYRANATTHFANARGLTIPAALEPVIDTISGLDDFEPHPLHQMLEDAPAFNSAGSSHYLSPDDLATIYNIKSLYNAGIDGTGQKIAVIGRTNIDLSDVRAFRRRFNLPDIDPQIVLFGPNPGVNANDAIESQLDLQWSGAVARNATIIYVNSASVRTSAQYAVDQNLAPVITYSYGTCEQYAVENQRAVAQQANAQGITWLVASGDSLAAQCDSSSPIPLATRGQTAAYPASIPEVTAVGGTEFNEGAGLYWNGANDANLASAIGYIPERPWNNVALRNALIGGGGGASVMFAKPGWQSGPGVPNDNARDIPDISLTASAAHDGFLVILSGALRIIGGTSASAPAFAGIVALLNHSLNAKQPGVGNINPALYRMAQSAPAAFHDITEGDIYVPCQQGSPDCVNGKLGFAAGPGYDLASGLGTVDAGRLIALWNPGVASTTLITATPTAITPADRIQLKVTVTGSSGPPNGTITFVTNDIAFGVASLSSGAASLTIDAALAVRGDGRIYASYSGDAIYAPSAAQATVTLKPSGSFVVPSISPYPVTQSGATWPYTLRLTEKAGTATTITTFTVDGVNNLTSIGNPALAANGVFSLSLTGRNLTLPLTRNFHFEGADADGRAWAADLAVPFVGQIGTSLAPSISLTALPASIQQNPQAPADCRWQAQLLLQERSGFSIPLSSFSVSGTPATPLSQLFGTNRLAAYGTLRGTYCFAESITAGSKTFSLLGSDERGGLVTAAAVVTLASAAATPATFTASANSLSLTSDGSARATGTLDLTFTGASPAWTATIVGAPSWLSLGAASGTGNDKLTVRASPNGLSRGAYAANIVVQAAGAVPQAITIPVFFTTGASPLVSITGVANAASFAPSFAPGMLLAVFGSNLAPAVSSAAIQPLPYSLQGVTAAVNGISAPLWFVSPGQLNIQIPYEITSGPAILAVNNNGQIASWVLPMGIAAPGIFADASRNLVPFASGAAGQTVVAFVTGDGDVTPSLPTGTSPASGTALSRLPSSRQSVSVTVNGQPAKIAFNGIVPGLIGVTQINFTIPDGLAPADYPVVVTVGGVPSAPVNFTVR